MPQKSRIMLFPSPVGGLNARDAYDAMPPSDAVQMVNFFPEATYVRVRTGLLNISGPVAPDASSETAPMDGLIPYDDGASRYVMSISGGNFYIRYSSGTGPNLDQNPVSGATATPGAIWRYVQFGALGGTYTLAFNGVNKPFYWQGGLTLTDPAFTEDTTTGNTQVLNENLLLCATSYAQFLFMPEANSLRVWYPSTAGAFQGACQYLDLTPFAKKGGSITDVCTWTYTTSLGAIYQVLACITSEGEVILYNGTNPESASTWNMVGQFTVGRPVAGSRATCQLGPDAVFLCEDGFQPLQSYLQGGAEQAPGNAISAKIGNLVKAAMLVGRSLAGWQVIVDPLHNMGIVNVPQPGGTWNQYVWNTITGAWCEWTGINTTNWLFFDDILMLGSQGNILYQAEITTAQYQAEPDLVQPTNAFLQTAFQYPNESTQHHHFKMAQPSIVSDVVAVALMNIETDFAIQEGPTTVPLSAVATPGGAMTQTPWVGLAAYGMPASLTFSVQTGSTNFQLNNTKVVYEEGGTI